MKKLGFINVPQWTDIRSYEIFEKNGETFAVEVKKEIDTRKLPFYEGGFSGYFDGTEEAYCQSNRIVRIGSPFKLVKRSNGWGFFSGVVAENAFGLTSRESAEQLIAEHADRRVEWSIYEDARGVFTLIGWALTPTGKRRKKFHLLGDTIENQCKYFFDHNF